MTENEIIIYCDGACSGNPGQGGWGSIVIFSDSIIELGGYESQATNNQMEILAAIRALEFVQKQKLAVTKITVYTDSSYLINAITNWIFGWLKNNWVTSEGDPVKNKEYFHELLGLVKNLELAKIDWRYVPGHQGVLGNERVDQIAVAFSKGENTGINLYQGPKQGYPYPEIFAFDCSKVQKTTSVLDGKNKKNKKAIGYLALVSGQLFSFKTWEECSKVVQGRSGAKYKKFSSKEEAQDILKSWNISTQQIEEILNAF
jgi:ribonuclease HI